MFFAIMESVTSQHPNPKSLQLPQHETCQPETIAHQLPRPRQQQKASSQKMKSLPIEILDQICTTLDLDTLPNFRLASKTFAAVGSQYLFEEFHQTYCPSESFTRFNSISDHETLRQHVKSLLFQGDSVTMEEISKMRSCGDVEHSCCALINGRHMDRAKARSVFLAAIGRFQNLESITLALAMPVREKVHEERNRWQEELYCTRAPAQFSFLAGYLQSKGLPLKCLRLGTVHSMDFETMTSFHHLQRLDLALPSNLSQDDYARLFQLLNSVPELRILRLAQRVGSPFRKTHLQLRNVIDSCTMPSLTSVTFAQIQVWSDKLLAFLRRHVQALNDVRLEDVIVTVSEVMILNMRTPGSLEDFLEQMQRVLRLERIHITGDFRTTSGKSMILNSRSRQGHSLRKTVERYLMEAEPSPFAVAGIEYAVSNMLL